MVELERYDITEEQWERIKDFFPQQKTGRPTKISNRDAFNAVIWLSRTGSPWRDLPRHYGPWQTVYSRWRIWTDSGLLERIFQALGIDPDRENMSLDSITIKVHQKAFGAQKKAAVTFLTKRSG